MRGGVTLFRGPGVEARRYVDADHARSVKACHGEGDCRPEYVELDQTGAITARRVLTGDEYARWVDWINPITGEQMGRPRRGGQGRSGSVRFADMSVNVPREWSIAAATDSGFAAALDVAQYEAATRICDWVAQHALTRVGSRQAQAQLPVEGLQIVTFRHDCNRLGAPYRHVHIQIGARVWAAGKWRALALTELLFKQQARIREIGAAIINTHRLQPPTTERWSVPGASTFTSLP